MIIALLTFIVSLKVYKKTTPNGKVTVYLGKRDFIDHCDGNVDPVEGIVNVEENYLKGRKIYSQLIATYRYGREEDEVMGVKFSKVLPLSMAQVVPLEQEKTQITKLQQRLMDKLGGGSYPFNFKFPVNAPSSVVIQSGQDEPESKPLGVEYRVRTFVGESAEDPGHKRSTVSMAIKKLQFAPIVQLERLPSALASKNFSLSQGRVTMEITLGKEVCYHGENIQATLVVNNNSRKPVKNLKLYIIQHVELTMVSLQLMNTVASLETREGCPITPGHSFSKEFILTPLASNNKEKRGVALDGYLKDDDVNLASSTVSVSDKYTPELLGIVISYTVRGKLGFGTLGGELVVDVPFKLVHQDIIDVSKSASTKVKNEKASFQRLRSIDRPHYEGPGQTADEEENIVFEDFSRTRLSESEIED